MENETGNLIGLNYGDEEWADFRGVGEDSEALSNLDDLLRYCGLDSINDQLENVKALSRHVSREKESANLFIEPIRTDHINGPLLGLRIAAFIYGSEFQPDTYALKFPIYTAQWQWCLDAVVTESKKLFSQVNAQ